ncbi:MAG: SAM-dependent methyltransferase, partial [Candidatus Levyibacteriota bacterium]
IILLLMLSAVWPPDSPWSPWWKTNKDAGGVVIKLADITSKDTVYELGSGDGEFLLLAAFKTHAKCVGIEIDPLRYVIAQFRIKLSGLSSQITIKRKNFYDEDISPATVVYVYLLPRVVKQLTPKFKKELKKGTRVISYRYTISDLRLVKENKKHKLYFYEI